MRLLFGILTFAIFTTLSSASFAGTATPITVTTFSETEETVGSIGLRIEFGDVIKPSIVGTVRRTETDVDNDVTGALAEVAVPLTPEGGFNPILRIMGLFGDTDAQGMAGIGFDFGKNQGLLGLGVQGDYVDGGININEDGSVTLYIGGSSYDGAPDRKTTTTTVTP